MKISKQSRYGVRALIYLAKQGRTCSAREIADEEGIPYSFLEKTIAKLEKHGLVKTKRGPKGGCSLAMPEAAVTLADIIRAFENPLFNVSCQTNKRFLPKPRCPTRKAWRVMGTTINQSAEYITLADLKNRKVKKQKVEQLNR